MADRFTELLDHIKAEVAALFGHADPAVHAVAEKVTAAVGELQGDATTIEAEAKTDGEHLATEAVKAEEPVFAEDGHDAAHLAGEAVGDATSKGA